jgi:large subunit ribosomal protein L13
LDRFIERGSAFLRPNPSVTGQNQDIAIHPAAQFLDESRVERRILPREIHFANHPARRGFTGIGRFFIASKGRLKRARTLPASRRTLHTPGNNNQLTPPHAARNFRALSALMKTFSAKASEVPRKWWIIDANNQILGQVAVKAANLLRGKEKAIYTPHVDTGDFVVVINAEKVRLTGKKEEQKSFMSFSGFVGGHKTENARARRARHPELLVERAIRGMIPHNKLGRAVYRKLKVYRGNLHPHAAQQPAAVSL